MSTCKECGAEMQEGAKFCSVCGTACELKTEDNVTQDHTASEAVVNAQQPEANAQQFGAANNNAQQFGVANNSAQQFGAANNNAQQFGAANNNAQQFGAANNNAQQFGAANNNAQQFGAANNNAQQFGAANNNAQQFGAANNNAQQFGANNQQFGANNQQFANGAAQFQHKEGTAEYYGKQPYTPPADDATANKGVAICAYFGFLWLVPLLTTAKHSPFVKFHTNQAIVITIVSLIVTVMTSIFDWVLDIISWRFYVLTTIVEQLGGIFCLALMIWGIVYAAQGKMKEIPVIGQFKIIK